MTIFYLLHCQSDESERSRPWRCESGLCWIRGAGCEAVRDNLLALQTFLLYVMCCCLGTIAKSYVHGLQTFSLYVMSGCLVSIAKSMVLGQTCGGYLWLEPCLDEMN